MSPRKPPPQRQLLGTVRVLGQGTGLRLQIERAAFQEPVDSAAQAQQAAALFDALSERLSTSQAEQLQQHFMALLDQQRDYELATRGLREQVQRAIKRRHRDDLPALHGNLLRASQVSARVTQRLGELQRLIEDILASPGADPARHDLLTGAALTAKPFPAQLERRLIERRLAPRDTATDERRGRRSRLASVLGTSITLTGPSVICRLEVRGDDGVWLGMDAPHAVTLVDSAGHANRLTPAPDGSLHIPLPTDDAQLLLDTPLGHAIALRREP